MMKKSLCLLFVSLIMFSAVVNFVSADASDFISSGLEMLDNVLAGFTNFTWGQEDSFITKFFIFIIISLLVFSLLDGIGLFGNKGILAIISFAVGGLSTFFMGEGYLNIIQYLYTSFGGTLMVILPFLILSGFMYRAIKDGNVQMLVMQHVAWGVFSIFLIYAMISNWNEVKGAALFVFFAVIILSLLLTFANSWFVSKFNVLIFKAKAVATGKSIDEIERGMKVLRGTAKASEES